MHKVTITQQDGRQTMTTKCIVGGAVMSTRAIAYKMPTPRKKPTGEALEQARARWRHMQQVVQERKRNGA